MTLIDRMSSQDFQSQFPSPRIFNCTLSNNDFVCRMDYRNIQDEPYGHTNYINRILIAKSRHLLRIISSFPEKNVLIPWKIALFYSNANGLYILTTRYWEQKGAKKLEGKIILINICIPFTLLECETRFLRLESIVDFNR